MEDELTDESFGCNLIGEMRGGSPDGSQQEGSCASVVGGFKCQQCQDLQRTNDELWYMWKEAEVRVQNWQSDFRRLEKKDHTLMRKYIEVQDDNALLGGRMEVAEDQILEARRILSFYCAEVEALRKKLSNRIRDITSHLDAQNGGTTQLVRILAERWTEEQLVNRLRCPAVTASSSTTAAADEDALNEIVRRLLIWMKARMDRTTPRDSADLTVPLVETAAVPVAHSRRTRARQSKPRSRDCDSSAKVKNVETTNGVPGDRQMGDDFSHKGSVKKSPQLTQSEVSTTTGQNIGEIDSTISEMPTQSSSLRQRHSKRARSRERRKCPSRPANKTSASGWSECHEQRSNIPTGTVHCGSYSRRASSQKQQHKGSASDEPTTCVVPLEHSDTEASSSIRPVVASALPDDVVTAHIVPVVSRSSASSGDVRGALQAAAAAAMGATAAAVINLDFLELRSTPNPLLVNETQVRRRKLKRGRPRITTTNRPPSLAPPVRTVEGVQPLITKITKKIEDGEEKLHSRDVKGDVNEQKVDDGQREDQHNDKKPTKASGARRGRSCDNDNCAVSRGRHLGNLSGSGLRRASIAVPPETADVEVSISQKANIRRQTTSTVAGKTSNKIEVGDKSKKNNSTGTTMMKQEVFRSKKKTKPVAALPGSPVVSVEPLVRPLPTTASKFHHPHLSVVASTACRKAISRRITGGPPVAHPAPFVKGYSRSGLAVNGRFQTTATYLRTSTMGESETTNQNDVISAENAHATLPNAHTTLPNAHTTLPNAHTTLPNAHTTLPKQSARTRNASVQHAQTQNEDFVNMSRSTAITTSPAATLVRLGKDGGTAGRSDNRFRGELNHAGRQTISGDPLRPVQRIRTAQLTTSRVKAISSQRDIAADDEAKQQQVLCKKLIHPSSVVKTGGSENTTGKAEKGICSEVHQRSPNRPLRGATQSLSPGRRVHMSSSSLIGANSARSIGRGAGLTQHHTNHHRALSHSNQAHHVVRGTPSSPELKVRTMLSSYFVQPKAKFYKDDDANQQQSSKTKDRRSVAENGVTAGVSLQTAVAPSQPENPSEFCAPGVKSMLKSEDPQLDTPPLFSVHHSTSTNLCSPSFVSSPCVQPVEGRRPTIDVVSRHHSKNPFVPLNATLVESRDTCSPSSASHQIPGASPVEKRGQHFPGLTFEHSRLRYHQPHLPIQPCHSVLPPVSPITSPAARLHHTVVHMSTPPQLVGRSEDDSSGSSSSIESPESASATGGHAQKVPGQPTASAVQRFPSATASSYLPVSSSKIDGAAVIPMSLAARRDDSLVASKVSRNSSVFNGHRSAVTGKYHLPVAEGVTSTYAPQPFASTSSASRSSHLVAALSSREHCRHLPHNRISPSVHSHMANFSTTHLSATPGVSRFASSSKQPQHSAVATNVHL